MILDMAELRSRLYGAVIHYEKSAPTVSRWADELYQRIESKPDSVVLSEVFMVKSLLDDKWMPPNLAANMVFKLMTRLGQNTEGHAGF